MKQIRRIMAVLLTLALLVPLFPAALANGPEGVAPTNLALGKKAKQSSTYNDESQFSANKVNDGNTDGNCTQMHQTNHTKEEENPWWEVDLEAEYDIGHIAVWNRTDGYQDRLQHYTVTIYDANHEEVTSITKDTYPNPEERITLEEPQKGQFVRITLNGTNYLHLAELQVWEGQTQLDSEMVAAPTPVETAYVGNPLYTVSLEGGRVEDADGNVVEGTFSWLDEDALLSESGTYRAHFEPKDWVAYTGFDCEVPITAQKESNKPWNHFAELQRNFVNARYLAYFHYNINSFTDTPSWGTGNEDPKVWNPTALDCDQWAQACVDAGMRGGILTTKHHDGFALWDSKAIDPTTGEETVHDVGSATNTTDVVKEFTDAFRARGLKIGLYFSIWDMHAKVQRGNVGEEELQFVKDQITELLTNYGKIDYINFDGWTTYGVYFDDIAYQEIYDLVKSLQPDCVISNHSYECNFAHTELPFADAAYDGSTEYVFGDYTVPGGASDCIQNNWFWVGPDNESQTYVQRTPEYIAEKVRNYNLHNATYVLNLAPNHQGLIPPGVVETLKEAGKLLNLPPDIAVPLDDWGYQVNPQENLAFMKPAEQTVFQYRGGGYTAEIANDGRTDGNGASPYLQVSETGEVDDPWWRVDLEGNFEISDITVWNRTDAYMDELSNYTVSILDAEEQVVWSATEEDYPDPSATFEVPDGTIGRYVKVSLNQPGNLMLAEVVVRGTGTADAVTGVTLLQKNLTLDVGHSSLLTATVQPLDAQDQSLVWSSSDETVATVKDGMVTGVGEGEAVITVTAGNGAFSDTCAVTVLKKDEGGPTPGGGGSTTTRYTITVTQGAGGKISPSTTSVTKGGDKTFTITANEGYKISDVLVDGKSVGAVSTYTFKNVTARHTITAKFEKIEEITNVGGFIDVKSTDWFAEAVQYAVDEGLMNGTSSNTFTPSGATTRGMIVTILYRQAGSPKVESDKATWWSDARVWAMANGVSDGTNMDKEITREQLATMLYRYAELTGKDVSKSASLDSFQDGGKVSAYAVDALKWAAAEGIVTGKTGGIIDPQAGATRAETATMFMRYGA